MNVHLVQMDIEWERPQANRPRARRLINAAGVRPGDLVLLPEMFDTGFSVNVGTTADRDGESRRFIAATARDTQAHVCAGVTVIDPAGAARNRAVVASPTGAVVAEYDKSRLFPLGEVSEESRLSPGDRTVVFRWGQGADGITVAPLVCYDLRFPEVFGSALAQGAEAFAVIANWPAVRSAHWRALLVARAIENQAWVFGVNRTGRDPALEYAGGSLVVDPLGRILAEADAREQVLTCPVSRDVLDDWRGRFPAWRRRSGEGRVP